MVTVSDGSQHKVHPKKPEMGGPTNWLLSTMAYWSIHTDPQKNLNYLTSPACLLTEDSQGLFFFFAKLGVSKSVG